MNSKTVSVLLLVFFLASSPPSSSQEPDPDGFRWMTDLEQARTKATQEGRPLLLVFR